MRILNSIRNVGTAMLRRILRKDALHFLHIGKTGGSAVIHAIRPHLDTGRYHIHVHDHKIRLRDVPAGENVFFFLRDPIARFVSGYYSRRRQGQPRNFIPWSQQEKLAFDEFRTPNELALALSSSDEEKKTRAKFAMQAIGHVKMPYSCWFESEDYLRSRFADIFFIGFQENLTNDFEILKAKIGLPQSAKLPTDSAQAHRSPGNEERTMGDAAIANLKNWYREDFLFLEICKQYFGRRADH